MEETIKTASIQLFSVTQVMATLGYHLAQTNHGGLVFYNESRVSKGDCKISIRSAITYHNYPSNLDDMDFDAYERYQFRAARIVFNAKLQYSRKNKHVSATGDKIKFINASYTPIFLPELEDY
jgi:hypothetical protein